MTIVTATKGRCPYCSEQIVIPPADFMFCPVCERMLGIMHGMAFKLPKRSESSRKASIGGKRRILVPAILGGAVTVVLLVILFSLIRS